jgi:PPOX class probable F420-dependent enzyme
MPSGECTSLTGLPSDASAILNEARRGVLSTIESDGSPHSVPVVFVIQNGSIVSPIDNKPKRGGDLRRVRNLAADPRATLLVDHWDEDWTRLGWVMIRGRVEVHPIGAASEMLQDRFSQYTEEMTPGERALFLTPTRISWWIWTS